MGYITTFKGRFNLDKPLLPDHKAYLTRFAETRRMKRNPKLTTRYPDPLRKNVGLGIGVESQYYVGSEDPFGQDQTPDILDYNCPPNDQPALWCQWIPNEDGTAIIWDKGEKFYCYVEWIQYLIEHFLRPWGYILNGEVSWQGEESPDHGIIKIENNEVTVDGSAKDDLPF